MLRDAKHLVIDNTFCFGTLAAVHLKQTNQRAARGWNCEEALLYKEWPYSDGSTDCASAKQEPCRTAVGLPWLVPAIHVVPLNVSSRFTPAPHRDLANRR